MTLDLFGVEVGDGPRGEIRGAGVHTSAADKDATPANRSPRWVLDDPAPGSVLAQLGLKIRRVEWRTRDEARRDRDGFLARIYAQPRPELTVDDILAGNRPPAFSAFEVARNHVALGRIDGAYDQSGVRASGSEGAAVQALRRALNETVYTSAVGLPARGVAVSDGFADAQTHRAVQSAISARDFGPAEPSPLSDNSVVSQVGLLHSAKWKDPRYLRAVVRNRLAELYTLRSTSRKCGKKRYGKGGVTAFSAPREHGPGDYVTLSGIVTCGSVWCCPSCAARIGAVRGALISQIVTAHRATGGGVYMATLTFPHTATMTARQLRKVLAAAFQLMQQGSPWQRWKKAIRFVGSITSREVTYGDAFGFHPHIHMLVLTRTPLAPDAIAEFQDRLFEQWSSALARQDVLTVAAPSSEHGVRLQVCDDESYLQKLGLAFELAGAVHKIGRDGNRTMWEVMADYACDRNAHDAKILREYFRAMKGARQLTWSRGKKHAEDLREIYPPNVTDPTQLALLDGEDGNTAALTAADKKGVVVGTISAPQWDALVRVMRAARSDAATELVLAIEEHGAVGIQAVLESAYRVGLQLAVKRRRLRRWLFWLDPRRHADENLWCLL